MAKRIIWLWGTLVLIMVFSGSVLAQDCDCDLSISGLSLDRNVKTFNLPITLDNPCLVGGIQIHVIADPQDVIWAIDADTVGSRIAGWEYFAATPSTHDPGRLRIIGIANMPDGPNTPPLEAGSGLLCNVKMQFQCDPFPTNVTVEVAFDTVFISDESGYIIYDTEKYNCLVNIGEDNSIRADANCNGALRSSDVTYLVNYFAGIMPCPCSFRAGDANGDGRMIGGDVTFLVNYFSGTGDPPPPE